MSDQLSFIPLGGIGDVTKNMYVYEYGNEILIVDCGLGFADETMLGVDLLLPDISYLQQTKKRIVGMVFTHGHEDHVGALPFILPQLLSGKQQFKLYGSPFTAAVANEKLKEFGVTERVETVHFDNPRVNIGSFQVSFIRVTHSIPDTAHLFIKSPIGNFYHGSDFKFDDTPSDGKISDYKAIEDAGREGVHCLLSDCLGSERPGHMPTETTLLPMFEQEIAKTEGKCIVTTYSSNVARLNQVIHVSEKLGRRVCFAGRSLTKIKDIAQRLGYLKMGPHTEIQLDELAKYPPNQVTMFVAGSQGQEASALVRIANGAHREISLAEEDTVIFSADPIPGNETLMYELIDTLAKRGARVLYSPLRKDLHVSGHGYQEELAKLMSLTKPKSMIPIGGNFRHMVGYRNIAKNLGYKKSDVLLIEDGQEIIFSKVGIRFGRRLPAKQVYVDEISGEEVESFVLRDRQRLSEGGIVIVLGEIDAANGQLATPPDLIIRGFLVDEQKRLTQHVFQDIKEALKNRTGRITNWLYVRKMVGETVERRIFKDLKRRPLVLPVIIEV